MGVITFSSLKGGVGKTSASINIAHALARRGCETLLIDLDPALHTSSFFLSNNGINLKDKAPLSKLFTLPDILSSAKQYDSLIDIALSHKIPLIKNVRDCLSVLPGGSSLRHFSFGEARERFNGLFDLLVEELSSNFDYVIIDTPPDFNALTVNAIAVSDLCVVPVDASFMSIASLEELIERAETLTKPNFAILRTMVNRQARRIRKLSETELEQRLNMQGRKSETKPEIVDEYNPALEPELDIEDPNSFIKLLEDKNGAGSVPQQQNKSEEPQATATSPIYLLESVLYRSEQQNRLSFLRKTAFDTRSTKRLAECYREVARELEEVLALCEDDAPELELGGFLQAAIQ